MLRLLINTGDEYLKPGGALLVELAPEQEAAVEHLFRENPKFGDATIVRDLNGDVRVAFARARPVA